MSPGRAARRSGQRRARPPPGGAGRPRRGTGGPGGRRGSGDGPSHSKTRRPTGVENRPRAPRPRAGGRRPPRGGRRPGPRPRPEDVTDRAFTAGDADALRAAVVRMTGVLTETDTDRAAHALNALLAECGARPRLSRHDGHGWHLHIDRGEDAGWADWLLASGALALARLLSEHGRISWGECASPRCTTLFLDNGPGSARRYCSGACASRERVAAHRRRRRSAGAGAAADPDAPTH
ncbi:CGNR zinc finger domain-containing protein [Streptomyces sp. NPDC059544]|uniref:CGNR zinc finger domain-containing protein n=1 Tax=Streptomyces sp. NPDC059544 TaxID=3346861 RepID=UPI00368D1F31